MLLLLVLRYVLILLNFQLWGRVGVIVNLVTRLNVLGIFLSLNLLIGNL